MSNNFISFLLAFIILFLNFIFPLPPPVPLNSDLGGLRFGVDADGNYGYIKDGADTVTPFKTTEIIDLGTGTSFNVSAYDGFQNFSADNFIVPSISGYVWNQDGGAPWSATVSSNKSYNKNTGILTASVILSGQGSDYATGAHQTSRTIAMSVHAFLIIGK